MFQGRRFRSLGVLLLMGLGALGACQVQEAATTETGQRKVLSTVNGDEITQEQVHQAVSDGLTQLEMKRAQAEATYLKERHSTIESKLEEMIAERLLEAEATARGLSRHELLQEEVAANVSEPDEASVEELYERNKNRFPAGPDALREQIRSYLKQENWKKTYNNFVERLKESYPLETNFEPLRFELETSGHPRKGPEEAPITLVEFSDFECPFCLRFNKTIQEVTENYGEKVSIIFRQFPLANHSQAKKAAQASLCAHEQGAFWPMHDLLFEEPRRLGIEDLKTKAVASKLDADQFNSCLDSGKFAEQVSKDLMAGSRVGVSGTPAIFVNGRHVPGGAVPFETLSKYIDEELERVGAAQ